MKRLSAALVLGLWLSGCGGPAENGDNAILAATNQTDEPGAAEADETATGADGLASCPFRETTDWHAFVEGGRLKINGKVDLLMAGFKPVLTKRDSASSGTVAFDLSLVQEAGAAVNDRVRFSGVGAPGARAAEIYCDGKQIARLDLILVD